MYNRKEMHKAFEGSWEPAEEEEDLLSLKLLEQYVAEEEAARGLAEVDWDASGEFWDDVLLTLIDADFENETLEELEMDEDIDMEEMERQYRRELLDRLYGTWHE